jgi:hypothetical protein
MCEKSELSVLSPLSEAASNRNVEQDGQISPLFRQGGQISPLFHEDGQDSQLIIWPSCPGGWLDRRSFADWSGFAPPVR